MSWFSTWFSSNSNSSESSNSIELASEFAKLAEEVSKDQEKTIIILKDVITELRKEKCEDDDLRFKAAIRSAGIDGDKEGAQKAQKAMEENFKKCQKYLANE